MPNRGEDVRLLARTSGPRFVDGSGLVEQVRIRGSNTKAHLPS